MAGWPQEDDPSSEVHGALQTVGRSLRGRQATDRGLPLLDQHAGDVFGTSRRRSNRPTHRGVQEARRLSVFVRAAIYVGYLSPIDWRPASL